MTDNRLAKLPLLQQLVDSYEKSKPLSGNSLLLVQHQLADAPAQIEAFLALGIKSVDIYWIDIPYTSFASIRAEVKALGVPEANFLVTDLIPIIGYGNWQVKRVKNWLNEHRDTSQRWLILDDGGYVARALAMLDDMTKTYWISSIIGIVEQTQRGSNSIRADAAAMQLTEQLPVINVAESRAKKSIESPMIAKAVIQVLFEMLRSTRPFDSYQETLVLGYGSIGEALAHELISMRSSRNQNIWIHDIDPLRLEIAKAKGFDCWADRRGEKADLVIGCSGNVSFLPEDVGWLSDGALIVSAGSGSIEVSRDLFLRSTQEIMLEQKSIGDGLIPVKEIHSDLKIKTGDIHFTIANGGFPVNFDGKRTNRIPLQDIQVTASLMVYGAIQALETGSAGLLEVDEAFEDWLIKAMSQQNRTCNKQQPQKPPMV